MLNVACGRYALVATREGLGGANNKGVDALAPGEDATTSRGTPATEAEMIERKTRGLDESDDAEEASKEENFESTAFIIDVIKLEVKSSTEATETEDLLEEGFSAGASVLLRLADAARC